MAEGYYNQQKTTVRIFPSKNKQGRLYILRGYYMNRLRKNCHTAAEQTKLEKELMETNYIIDLWEEFESLCGCGKTDHLRKNWHGFDTSHTRQNVEEWFEAYFDININRDIRAAYGAGVYASERYNPITRKLVEIGYKNGIIMLTNIEGITDTVCMIGKKWFYFGGMTAAQYNAEDYKKNIPEETIIDEIFNVLEALKETSKEEYAYYKYILENY